MHDYYQVLGIARSASPQVVKLAFEGKLKALADPAYVASAQEKRDEERLLREAFITLSMPAKRGPYDARLAASESPGFAEEHTRPAWLVPVAVVAALVLAAGALWVNHSREKERIRLEEERIAMERESARRKAEFDDNRLLESAARREAAVELTKERNEQIRVQRERAEYDRQKRAQEASVRQSDSARANQARSAILEKQREEERLRRADEDRRRQALHEVERQKNYLRQLEYEEERVRAARHERAQREAREIEYKRMIEERQNRLQQQR